MTKPNDLPPVGATVTDARGVVWAYRYASAATLAAWWPAIHNGLGAGDDQAYCTALWRKEGA